MMNEKDNITNLFERLQGDFDIETPELGHERRFLKKLQQQQKSSWRPFGQKYWE